MGDLTMAMSKAEVRRAFRAVMAADYADVPAAEEIGHVFSAGFLSAVARLVEEEKRGSWCLLSRQRRRALMVAAILAAALLLTACSPKLREAVTEFVVSFYERVVDYQSMNPTREKIETVYVLYPVPEGFAQVSQTKTGDIAVETYYQDPEGKTLVLRQFAVEVMVGSIDNQHGEVLIVGEGSDKVLMYCSETMTVATWVYDGYFIKLSYSGKMDSEKVLALVASLAPMETGPSEK